MPAATAGELWRASAALRSLHGVAPWLLPAGVPSKLGLLRVGGRKETNPALLTAPTLYPWSPCLPLQWARAGTVRSLHQRPQAKRAPARGSWGPGISLPEDLGQAQSTAGVGWARWEVGAVQ